MTFYGSSALSPFFGGRGVDRDGRGRKVGKKQRAVAEGQEA